MFTKKDLKPGMLVVYRNGACRVITECAERGMIFVGDCWFSFADQFKDDLRSCKTNRLDIMKVYNNDCCPTNLLKNEIGRRTLIWDREETKRTER